MATNQDLANLFVRIGLAITLLIAVIIKFTSTEEVTGLFEQLLGYGSSAFTIIIAIFLLLMALGLLIGWQLRIVGILLSIFFAVTLITGVIAGGPLFTVGPAIWKDWALLGASLSVAFQKPGRYNLKR